MNQNNNKKNKNLDSYALVLSLRNNNYKAYKGLVAIFLVKIKSTLVLYPILGKKSLFLKFVKNQSISTAQTTKIFKSIILVV